MLKIKFLFISMLFAVSLIGQGDNSTEAKIIAIEAPETVIAGDDFNITVNYQVQEGYGIAAYRIVGYKYGMPNECRSIARFGYKENLESPDWGSCNLNQWKWMENINYSKEQVLTVSTVDWPTGDYKPHLFLLIRQKTANEKTDKYLSREFKIKILPHTKVAIPQASTTAKVAIPQASTTAKAKDYYGNPALNHVTFLDDPQHQPINFFAEKGYVIIPDNTLNGENNLAKQLTEYLRQISGQDWEIRSDARLLPESGTLILLGKNRLCQQFRIPDEKLPEQGFRVISFSRGLAITGESGLSFGVYDVLERFFGVRWYYPGNDGTIVPEKKELILYPVHYIDYPRSIRRTMWPWFAFGMLPDDALLSRKQVESHPGFAAIRSHYRSCESGIAFGCHTPSNIGFHYQECPETFELLANGKRNNHTPSGSGGTPCYGNPATLQWHLDDLRRFFSSGNDTPWTNPGQTYKRGLPSNNIIAFSPPDKSLDCHCQYCQKLIDPNGGATGTYSKIFGQFVLGMAEAIKKDWPQKQLAILPYQNYTEPALGLQLPDNTHAMICLMSGIMPMKEPEIRKRYDRWISGWKQVTGNPIYLWEYLCWPENHALPLHYPHTLQKFYRDHKGEIAGAFINGGAGPQNIPGQQWACRHPDIYIHFRLLWNPDYDVDAMMGEYVRLMYGPASEPMRDLFSLLAERCEQVPWRKIPASYKIDLAWIHEDTMPQQQAAKLKELLEKARAITGTDGVFRRRVDFYGQAVDFFLMESAFYHDPGKLPKPPVLEAVKTKKTIICDGKLDEVCWQDAPVSELVFAFPSIVKPAIKSVVKTIWKPEGLYLGMELMEPFVNEMKELIKSSTPYLYEDNCVEIFIIDPFRKQRMFQIYFNSLGHYWIWEYNDQKRDGAARLVQLGVTKSNDRWIAEIFIPAAIFKSNANFPPGQELQVNIIRNRNAAGRNDLYRWGTRFSPVNSDIKAFGTIKCVEP